MKTIDELKAIIKSQGAGALTPPELAQYKKLVADAKPIPCDRKTRIYALRDAGVGSRDIGAREGVSVDYIRRILRERPGGNRKSSVEQHPLNLPELDMTKPLSPQYEALGAAILTEAARNGEIGTRQIAAARELIRMAQRDKVPPPVSRKLRFVIETIDVLADDEIHVVNVANYEIHP